MANLQACVNDGIEIYVDNVTGESFASVRGYARMSDKPESSIRSRITARKVDTKMTEVLTPQGLRTARLLSEDTIVDWLTEDNPQLAKKMSKLGVRVFMHQLAGYQVTTTAVAPESDEMLMARAIQASARLLEAAKQEIKELKTEAAVNAPKVKLANQFIERDGLTMIGDFAKDSGKIGRNRLFELLRDKGVLLSNNHPKQVYVDRGLFVLRPCDTLLFGREQFTTHLTPEGVQWLCKRLEDWLAGE